MCRFYSIYAFQTLGKEGYEYVFRIDEDGIIGDIPFDIFHYMKINTYIYGFRTLKQNSLNMSSLLKTVQEFIDTNPDIVKRPLLKNNITFYTNLLVTKTSFWNRKIVTQFLNYLDNSGGYYKYGWGDSSIVAITLQLFAEPDELVQFTSFEYSHGSHGYISKKYECEWIFVRRDLYYLDTFFSKIHVENGPDHYSKVPVEILKNVYKAPEYIHLDSIKKHVWKNLPYKP